MENLNKTVGNIDIYLIDQILKERYKQEDVILDAGCGNGRNLKWFYNNDINFYGIDIFKEQLHIAQERYPLKKDNFSASTIEELPFKSETFNHIICNAVLHFANNTEHFKLMFAQLVRVLQPKGSLFIRMSSTIGFQGYVTHISDGVYKLPHENQLFLLTKELLKEQMQIHNLSFLEPLKTVIVDDIRTMTTLVLTKI